MINKNVTVWLVGTGGIAGVHAAGHNRCESVELKVYNRTRAKAERFAEKYRVSEIIDTVDEVFSRPDIDAVDICVNHDLHLDFCLRAFANGKHVLLEKPMANSLEDADKMIAADDHPDYDVYNASVQDFVKAVKGEKDPHVSGQAARDDIAVVFAAYESDRTNSVVKLS